MKELVALLQMKSDALELELSKRAGEGGGSGLCVHEGARSGDGGGLYLATAAPQMGAPPRVPARVDEGLEAEARDEEAEFAVNRALTGEGPGEQSREDERAQHRADVACAADGAGGVACAAGGAGGVACAAGGYDRGHGEPLAVARDTIRAEIVRNSAHASAHPPRAANGEQDDRDGPPAAANSEQDNHDELIHDFMRLRQLVTVLLEQHAEGDTSTGGGGGNLSTGSLRPALGIASAAAAAAASCHAESGLRTMNLSQEQQVSYGNRESERGDRGADRAADAGLVPVRYLNRQSERGSCAPNAPLVPSDL